MFLKHKPVFHASVLFVLCIAVFLSLVSDCMPINGDVAAYNQQIEGIVLNERTVHWGFIAVGILFTRMMPFPVDLSMNIFAALLGATGISATFLVCYKLTNDALASYLSAVILLSSKTFFENAVFTDIYQAQTVFILLAVLFWLYQKSDLLVALFFLIAQLINPFTVVTIPLMFLTPFSYKRIVKIVLYVLLAYIPFLCVYWNDLWYSQRGVLGTTSYGIYNYFPFFWRLRDTLYHILCDFNYTIVFIVIGCVWVLFLKSYVLNKFFVLITMVFFGLISCVPDNKFAKMQVFFPWLSVAGGIVVANLRNVSVCKYTFIYRIFIAATSVFFVCFIAGNISYVCKKRDANELFKTFCRDVNRSVKKGCFVVADWDRGLLYERYNFNNIYTGRVFSPLKREFADIALNDSICVLDYNTKDFINKKFNVYLKEIKLNSGIIWVK